MNFLTKYKPFYKENLRLAFPVILSQLGQITVQLADTAMVGHYGGDDPNPLAAVSYASNLFFIVFIAVMGVTFGLTPLVGEHYAKGNKAHAAKLLKNGAVLFTAISIATTLLLIALRPLFGKMGSIMIASGSDASITEVTDMALPYYDMLIWSLLPVMIWGTVKQFLEGIGNTRIAMVTIIISNSLNIFLNWVLIYGKLGAPQLGVTGGAWATFISRIVAAALFIVLLFKVEEYNKYLKFISGKIISLKMVKEQLRLSIPISLQSTLEVTAFSLAAIMVGWLGKYELAAHQVAQSLSTFTFLIATGIGAAATIRVSHQYGSGNFHETEMAGKASVHIAVAFMSFCGILFIAFKSLLPFAFTEDPNVIPIAEDLIVILALFQIFDATQLASLSSLRGLKDIKIPLLFSLIAYYLICLPVAYLLGFKAGLGPTGVWIGLAAGLAIAAITFYLRFLSICKKMNPNKNEI